MEANVVRSLMPQPYAWQDISILQALWNSNKSHRNLISFGRMFHRAVANALVEAKQIFFRLETTSRCRSVELEVLQGTYGVRGSYRYVGPSRQRTLKANTITLYLTQ